MLQKSILRGRNSPTVGLGRVFGGLGEVLVGSWCVLWGLGESWGVSGMIFGGSGMDLGSQTGGKIGSKWTNNR